METPRLKKAWTLYLDTKKFIIEKEQLAPGQLKIEKKEKEKQT